MGMFDINTGSSATSFKFFRGDFDSAGEPIFVETDKDDFIVPPAADYLLAIVGFTKPRTSPSTKFTDNEGNPKMQTLIDVEVEIRDGRGTGKRFIWGFVGFSLWKTSKLGKIYRQAVLGGGELPENTQLSLTELFSHEFRASVANGDKKDGQGRPVSAYVIPDTARPAGDDGAYDPFNDKVA